MKDAYEMAQRLLNNIRLSSDNVEMSDCYYLCAYKQHLSDLRVRDHQVIWGRRGTGKTTLLKAFTYETNYVIHDPEIISIYIMMASIIPTEEEISKIIGDSSGLDLYVFSKLIYQITEKLENIFDERKGAMDEKNEYDFMDAFYILRDYLSVYQTYVKGGEYSIENLQSTEIKNEIQRNIGLEVKQASKVFEIFAKIFGSKEKTNKTKNSFSVSGKVQFHLETQEISKLLSKMLRSLGISLAYICLDEYSEIDKISEYTIQSKVASLLKQIFFKTPLYSVKIATIWNKTKLHVRGGNYVHGIEYKQDIFAGPDLDIMFMGNNFEVLDYFKEILINTYLMGTRMTPARRSLLSDFFESDIFGKSGLRHLICGSQGVSRAFVVLVKTYLQKYLKEKSGVLKLSSVYEIIKHQYVEDVRYKIPVKYSLYREVDNYVTQNLCRYFLVSREDYSRCKVLIKYLSARGLYMQIPGQNTDKRIRDDYKLFVVHYGSYLDALESEKSHKSGRKQLTEDAKLEPDGKLIPEYDADLILNPEKYTIRIPENAENEVYCSECDRIFLCTEKGTKVHCPSCGREMLKFEAFIDEVAI